MSFTVDREVEVSVPITRWVVRRFRAVPGEVYDAALTLEGGHMTKFQVQFAFNPIENRDDEMIEADYFEDNNTGEFVDFNRRISGEVKRVARYRAADIRRILRVEGD